MDDDEEGPLQCMLHMSGDTEHNGDAVIHLLNRHGKLLGLYLKQENSIREDQSILLYNMNLLILKLNHCFIMVFTVTVIAS